MRPVHRLLAGLAITAAVLFFYDRDISTRGFDFSTTSQEAIEKWHGVEFNASTVGAIKTLISRQAAEISSRSGCERPAIFWLGNSQLHFVNQFQRGDHAAPYWLRQKLDCAVPLGMSLANAGLQEQYVLAGYAASHLPARMILLELCFDDMREDGLRAEFSGFIDSTARKRLTSNPVGHEIVTRGEAAWNKADAIEGNGGLQGFAQKVVEDRLNDVVGNVWPFWRERADLRTQALVDLYFLRNALLGIKATTVRKMIAPRYARNMAALRQLLSDAQRDGIAVVAYVAPIRQDVSLPYDPDEYRQWKGAVAALVQQHGADFVNLETLVPPVLWGTSYTDDIDFMHFRGEGHKLLAHALLPYVEGAK